jgi:hypothetical protein
MRILLTGSDLCHREDLKVSKTVYQIYILEDGEWCKATRLYPTYRAAFRAVSECQYSPDEYKIIKIEKEI